VAFDGVDSAKAFATKTGVTYPLWLDPDGATQRALKVSVLPTTVFVSADGVVRRTTFGALDESKLRSTITEVFGSAVGA
jgi:peroxiredoxin